MPKKNCDFFAMKKKTHGRRRTSALSLTAGRRRRRIDTTSDRLATKFRVVENCHPVLSLLGFLATTTGWCDEDDDDGKGGMEILVKERRKKSLEIVITDLQWWCYQQIGRLKLQV
jgi:hypothetical protein